MTFEITLVLSITAMTFALFASERLPVEMVALVVMVILGFSGLVTPVEAVSGFASTATVTVAAVFILGAGVTKTGIIKEVGHYMAALARGNTTLLIFLLMLGVGFFSSFLNNTAAVAVFLPLAMRLSQEYHISPSLMLMPLGFASIAGGTMTLIGTSTNILIDSIVRQHGLTPFGLFEFTPLGAVFFVVLLGYMTAASRWFIPARRAPGSPTAVYRLSDYIATVSVTHNSLLVGETVVTADLHRRHGVQVLSVTRGDDVHLWNLRDLSLQGGDTLLVEAQLDELLKLVDQEAITLVPENVSGRAELVSDETILAEAIIPRDSPLVGATLKSSRFRGRYGVFAVAIRHQGRTFHSRLEEISLRVGDALLLQGTRENFAKLRDGGDFLLIEEFEETHQRTGKRRLVVAIISGVILLAATGIWPILLTALAGAIAMVLGGVLTRDEAVDSIDWSVIFLLGGIIPLGLAMQNTGAAAWLAEMAVGMVSGYGPSALVGAIYLLTSLLTAVMSNNASAVLLAPIVITMAESLQISARPLLFAVAFAASASFLTPIGYHVNTMMYGPGGYRFFDYTRIGWPLNVAFVLLAAWLIPRFWPF
ncbi:MAG: SLC13 family permease [Thermaerobacterales bacterium]